MYKYKTPSGRDSFNLERISTKEKEMKAEEIEEANKLIHEFMNKPDHVMPVLMKYHCKWDWLIPVFNKCYEKLYERPDLIQELNKQENFVVKFGIRSALNLSDITNQLQINSAWLKITNFIKWYNTQNH
jgi:hypothetical protein